MGGGRLEVRLYFKRDLSVSVDAPVEGAVGNVEAVEVEQGKLAVRDGERPVEYYYRKVRRE